MSNEEKPFVCVKGGAVFNITPRNRAGWIYLLLWTAPILAAAACYEWAMERIEPEGANQIAALAVLVVGLLLWSAAMIRWMYVRSEVIDLREVDRIKRDGGRSRGRKGRE